MKTIVRILLLVGSFLTVYPPVAAADSPALGGGSASGASGTTVTIPINFTAGSTQVAALQFSIGLPNGWTIASVSPGAASTSSTKTVNVNPASGMILVFGDTQSTLATGVVADLQVSIPSSAGFGSYSLPLSGIIFSDPSGASIQPGSSVSGSITVQSGSTPVPPVISSFTASPASVTAGGSSTLSWSVTGASSLSISPTLGLVTGVSISVSPSATTTYTLTATNSAGSVTATTTVTIQATNSVPTISSFTASPSSISAGASSMLSWNVTGATSLGLTTIGTVTGTSVSVSPTVTTTYTLIAMNNAGSVTATTTVTVQSGSTPVPPVISSFTASPASVTAGGSSTLSWTVSGASSLSISPTLGVVSGASISISPSATTTYTLTATNSAGSVTATVTVVVQSSNNPVPTISNFNASPSSIAAGSSSTLSWNVTGASSLSISPALGTVAGTSVSVSPTAATTYTLTATNNSGSVTATTTVTVNVSSTSGPLQFVTTTPCRVADTRNSSGPFGGPEMAANSTRSFSIPSSSCAIPATAVAYSLNVTVVPNAQLSYLTIWPAGQAQPLVSTLNSDGRVKSNAAIVPSGSGGAVTIYVTDSTQVIIDIDGYFVPAGTTTSALAFYPVPPCRIADTRQASGPLAGPYLSGGAVGRSLPILSSSCLIPTTAQAYSLNFTAVPHGPLGYLTVWPSGQSQPLVSTLNASTGTATANAALVPAASNGNISVYASNDTDLVIDINGYFAAPGRGGLSLYTLPPCRVLDTRNPPGSLPFNGTLAVNVVGSCGVPFLSLGYVLNATVVPQGALHYLMLGPYAQTPAVFSTLNALDGTITSNMAIVSTTNGLMDALVTDPTQLILDISGYFAP